MGWCSKPHAVRLLGWDIQYYCDIAMAPVPYAQALTMLLLLEMEQGGWLEEKTGGVMPRFLQMQYRRDLREQKQNQTNGPAYQHAVDADKLQILADIQLYLA